MNTTISNTQRNVLLAVNRGHSTRSAIAAAMSLTPATVSTSLASLKTNGLIEAGAEGGYVATADAEPHIGNGRIARTGTKMEAARKIFDKFQERGRQVVLDKLVALGLTEKGASTYYQTLKTAHQAAAVAAAPAKKTVRKSKAVA